MNNYGNRKYYALSGENGFAVFNNIRRAQEMCEYIKGAKIEAFNTMQQAFVKARDNYNDQQTYGDVDDLFYGYSTDIKLNWVQFRKEIRKKNREETPCAF